MGLNFETRKASEVETQKPGQTSEYAEMREALRNLPEGEVLVFNPDLSDNAKDGESENDALKRISASMRAALKGHTPEGRTVSIRRGKGDQSGKLVISHAEPRPQKANAKAGKSGKGKKAKSKKK